MELPAFQKIHFSFSILPPHSTYCVIHKKHCQVILHPCLLGLKLSFGAPLELHSLDSPLWKFMGKWFYGGIGNEIQFLCFCVEIESGSSYRVTWSISSITLLKKMSPMNKSIIFNSACGKNTTLQLFSLPHSIFFLIKFLTFFSFLTNSNGIFTSKGHRGKRLNLAGFFDWLWLGPSVVSCCFWWAVPCQRRA